MAKIKDAGICGVFDDLDEAEEFMRQHAPFLTKADPHTPSADTPTS